LRYETGQPKVGLELLEKARMLRQKLADDNPADRQLQSELATSLHAIR